MSFTIARTYTLAVGNYVPRTAMKFRGEIVNGVNEITVRDTYSGDILAAAATMTSPCVIGSGLPKRDPVSGVLGDVLTVTTNAVKTGIYEFYLIDDAYPSTYDMPIKAFHVLGAPGTFTFKTLDGATVSLTSAQLAVGGIYDYSISEVIALTTGGTILGLSPEGQRSIY